MVPLTPQPSFRLLTAKTEGLRPDLEMKLHVPRRCLLDSVQGTGSCVHGGADC